MEDGSCTFKGWDTMGYHMRRFDITSKFLELDIDTLPLYTSKHQGGIV